MAISYSETWGPYADPLQARTCLTRFVDAACGPDIGVAWASGGSVWPMRAARRDAFGLGQVVVFEWRPAPPPRQIARPQGWLDRMKEAIESALTQIGEQQVARSEATLAMTQTIAQAVGSIRMQHKDDAAGVALDVVCVALSIGILGAGMSLIGGAALLGGAVLLLADGIAYGMEMSGYDEAAEKFKTRTELFRMVATVMTIPDAAWGGARAMREFQEVRELRTASQATARIAGTLADRTANAARASRYAEIVERAQRKAQIHAGRLRSLFLHELTPRATVPVSLYLLLREELDDKNHSGLARFLQRLTFHVVTIQS